MHPQPHQQELYILWTLKIQCIFQNKGSDTYLHRIPAHDIRSVCTYIVQSAGTLHMHVGNVLMTAPKLHKLFQGESLSDRQVALTMQAVYIVFDTVPSMHW